MHFETKTQKDFDDLINKDVLLFQDYMYIATQPYFMLNYKSRPELHQLRDK